MYTPLHSLPLTFTTSAIPYPYWEAELIDASSVLCPTYVVATVTWNWITNEEKAAFTVYPLERGEGEEEGEEGEGRVKR